jgi:uncharacterized protein (DUF433 family)
LIHYGVQLAASEVVPMERSIVTLSPDILSGTPVFAGTLDPVQALEGGETIEDFLADSPS